MKTMQRLLLMTACLFILNALAAQSAVNLKAGILSRTFADETDLTHCGQSIGMEIIVEDSKLLFMPGLHYQRYGITGMDEKGNLFNNSENIHQINMPVNLGAWLIRDKWMKVRMYGGGHVNFTVGVDKNDAGIHLDKVTTVHPGWQAGGQLLVWHFTLDIRYSADLNHLIKSREDSLVRGWEFLFGIAL